MSYKVKIEEILLSDYKEILSKANLFPGRKGLKDNLNENFELLSNCSINTLGDLLGKCKNKSKTAQLSDESGVPNDYLILLLREIKSYIPKPPKLEEFPEFDVSLLNTLFEEGITDAGQFYPKVLTIESRRKLALQSNVNIKEIENAAKMIDLSRVRWVSPAYAWVLVNTGYDTIQKVSEADAGELAEAVNSFNNKHRVYRGMIGLNDFVRTIESAIETQSEMEF